MVRRLAFLLGDPPLAGPRARERLDLVLMSLAYDLEVSVIFLGDGVWQLVRPSGGQGPQGFTRAYRSLELYGVAGVYAEDASLRRRGIDDQHLLMPVERLDVAAMAALLDRQDALL